MEDQGFHMDEIRIKMPGPIHRLQKAIMNVTRNGIEEFNRRFKDKVIHLIIPNNSKQNKGEDILNEQDVFNTSLNVVFYKMKAISGKFNFRGQQLLRDIFEFRMLLLHLIYCDPTEFYLKVLNLKNTASFESIWYIGDRKTMEFIDTLLDLSKQRVFKLKRDIDEENVLRKKKKDKNMEGESKSLIDDNQEMSNSLNQNASIPLEEVNGQVDNVKEEGTDLNDLINNPIIYKGMTFRLDLKINVNFKYKNLIEILKKITNKGNPSNLENNNDKERRSNQKKVIWIWISDEKKIKKIKDILTSFFSKKDDHKMKLLLTLHNLLSEMGVDKKDAVSQSRKDDEIDEEDEIPNFRAKKKAQNSEENIEKSIFKKLFEDLNHLKKEYDNKMMINLFSIDSKIDEASNSQTNTQPIKQDISIDPPLISLLQPKKKLKRKFYDLDEEDNEEQNEEEEKSLKIDTIIENLQESQNNKIEIDQNNIDKDDCEDNLVNVDDSISNKKVLTSEIEKEFIQKKKHKYTILNPEKVDINSFYTYSDDGKVIFDEEVIPGFQIIVNSLQSTSERVSFMMKAQPDIAILFEPQLSIIREIMLEKRCSESGKEKCSINEVNIFMVLNSIETSIYLDTVHRENSALCTLLKDRSSLPVLDDNPESRIKKIIYQKQISTRIGRGVGHAAMLNNRPIIIVDKREFSSPLPRKLYHDGFWIIPILLEKGDYVLSNSLVVERKCVETGDLLNSLRSGRLETQIKNLCATYSRPMLLIEFSDGVDFSMESAEVNRLQHNINWVNDFESDKTEINKSNIKYGLALMCVKYPKLTLLWSKSPEYSSKLFQKLREHNPDPNPREFAKFQEDSEKNNESDPIARHINNKDSEKSNPLGIVE